MPENKNDAQHIENSSRASGFFEAFWNVLTMIVIIATLAAIGLFVLIYQYPAVRFNPFPPPTLPALIALPTSTPTPPMLPATWTPTITQTVMPSITPEPYTDTLAPTMVGSDLLQAPVNTPDNNANYPFALQSEPAGIDASVLYPDRSCGWMGVGGQVTDLQGSPVTGITVQLGGSLNGKALDQTSLTGLATKYGEAGYEFELGKIPVNSTDTIWIRLIDQARLPLSQRVYFQTFEDCRRNLIIINFRQVRK